MPFVSRAQQRWGFATKQPFAKKWARLTKKKKGGFKALPQHVRGGSGKRVRASVSAAALHRYGVDTVRAAIAGVTEAYMAHSGRPGGGSTPIQSMLSFKRSGKDPMATNVVKGGKTVAVVKPVDRSADNPAESAHVVMHSTGRITRHPSARAAIGSAAMAYAFGSTPEDEPAAQEELHESDPGHAGRPGERGGSSKGIGYVAPTGNKIVGHSFGETSGGVEVHGPMSDVSTRAGKPIKPGDVVKVQSTHLSTGKPYEAHIKVDNVLNVEPNPHGSDLNSDDPGGMGYASVAGKVLRASRSAPYKAGDSTLESVSAVQNHSRIHESARSAEVARETIASIRESGCEPIVVPVRETGFVVSAQEAETGATMTGFDDGSLPVMVIREGDGNKVDGNYYTAGLIRKLVESGMLDAQDAYLDHASSREESELPERSVMRKAGWYSHPTLGTTVDESGQPIAAAYARFHPQVGKPEIDSLIRTTQEKFKTYPDKRPYVAFSLNGYAAGAAGENPKGEKRNVLEAMTALNSVDVVTVAGAGGGFVRESSRMETELDGLDLDIDVRTPEEKAADVKRMKESMRSKVVLSVANGPMGAAIREAAGAPATGNLSAAQIDSIAEKLGVRENSPFDQLLDDELGDDSDDKSEVEESSGVDGTNDEKVSITINKQKRRKTDKKATESDETEVEEALSEDAIDTMTPEQAKAELKKRSKKKAAKESDRLARLEEQVAESNRTRLIEAVFERAQIPDAHRKILNKILESAKTKADIIDRTNAYRKLNIIGHNESSGTIGNVRESNVVRIADAPNCLRVGR